MDGYKTLLKEASVTAFKSVFDASYNQDQQYRNLNIGIEYPVAKVSYPSLWVGFNETSVKNVGICHTEPYETEDTDGNPQTDYRKRWKFTGELIVTILALTSYERDHISDLLVSLISFGSEYTDTQKFLDSLKEDQFLSIEVDVDDLKPSGETASPGTPWGTDELIYECSYRINVIGEFVSSAKTLEIISRVDVFPYTAEDGDQTTSGGWQ